MTTQVKVGEDEIARYHRSTAVLVLVMLAFVILLTLLVWTGVLAFETSEFFDPALIWAFQVVIVMFGLGAFVLRHARFAPIRVQDILGLRGTEGVLASFQKTSILIAALGEAIGVIGFLISVITHDKDAVLLPAAISLLVLFYAYPRRREWERHLRAAQQSIDGGDDAGGASPTKGTFA